MYEKVKKMACVIAMMLAVLVLMPGQANAQTDEFTLTPSGPSASVFLESGLPQKSLTCTNLGSVTKQVTEPNCLFALEIEAGKTETQEESCSVGGFLTGFLMSPASSGDVECVFDQESAVATTVTSSSRALEASTSRFVDMVFVVDQSGSMADEHEWLKTAVQELESGLNEQGIGTGDEINQYGLVGFGGNDEAKRYTVGSGDFGSSEELVAALDLLPASGSDRDGYRAIDEALDYGFRSQAAVNIVVVTDIPRNTQYPDITYDSILEELSSQRALLNAVVNIQLKDGSEDPALGVDGDGNAYIADGSGGFSQTSGGYAVDSDTKEDYAELAWDSGTDPSTGAVWDLNKLRDGGDPAVSFSNAFVEVKVEEIEESAPIILGDGDGDFEVCANDEDGVFVYTILPAGGQYEFTPSGEWSPGDGEFYPPEGNGILADEDFAYPKSRGNYYEYSLIAEDTRYGLAYEVTSTPVLPIYYDDEVFFKMNDVVGEYQDNSGCLQIHYDYVGPIALKSSSKQIETPVSTKDPLGPIILEVGNVRLKIEPR